MKENLLFRVIHIKKKKADTVPFEARTYFSQFSFLIHERGKTTCDV